MLLTYFVVYTEFMNLLWDSEFLLITSDSEYRLAILLQLPESTKEKN